jgi:hypothetical protein
MSESLYLNCCYWLYPKSPAKLYCPLAAAQLNDEVVGAVVFVAGLGASQTPHFSVAVAGFTSEHRSQVHWAAGAIVGAVDAGAVE